VRLLVEDESGGESHHFIRMLSIAYHLDRVAVVVVQRFVEVVVDDFRKWKRFRFRFRFRRSVGFVALKILALARLKSRVVGCLLTEQSQNILMTPAKVEIFCANTQVENSLPRNGTGTLCHL
jgi:hypothetical protein